MEDAANNHIDLAFARGSLGRSDRPAFFLFFAEPREVSKAAAAMDALHL
ncbi:hypothetical protein [Cupriavidus sp. UME77]|nr:hypothetical protein [Cupriavidus sp. UME77]